MRTFTIAFLYFAFTVAGMEEDALAVLERARQLHLTGDLQQAEPVYKSAIARLRQDAGLHPANLPLALGMHGILLVHLGRLADAEPVLRESLALGRERLGDGHVEMAGAYAALGTLLAARREYARAEPVARKALALVENHLGEGHPETAGFRHQLAKLALLEGKCGQAESEIRRVLALSQPRLGEGHPEVLRARVTLARALLCAGQREEAAALLPALFHAFESSPQTEIDLIVLLTCRAELLESRGEYAGAVKDLRRSLEIMRKHRLETHPNHEFIVASYARVLDRAGEKQQARQVRETLRSSFRQQ